MIPMRTESNTLEDSTVQAAVGQLIDLPMDPLSVEVPMDSPHVAACDIPEEASAMKGWSYYLSLVRSHFVYSSRS